MAATPLTPDGLDVEPTPSDPNGPNRPEPGFSGGRGQISPDRLAADASSAQASQRALLAAMATQGTNAKDQFSQTQSLAAQQQQAAVLAAAQRAEAIGAPSDFNAQLQGQVGAAYGDAGLSLAARHQANQREGSAVQSATGNYLGQLKAAMPVIQSKQAIAIQQILADRADKEANRAYDQKNLAYQNKRLDAELAKLSAETSAAGSTGSAARYTAPLTSGQAANFLGIKAEKQADGTPVSPLARIQYWQATPDYQDGVTALQEAKQAGRSLDEVTGLLRATQVENSDGTTRAIDPDVLKLLLATYAPTFRTASDVKDAQARDLARKQAEHDIVSGTGAGAQVQAEDNAATRLVAEGIADEKKQKEAAKAAAAALAKAEKDAASNKAAKKAREAEMKKQLRAQALRESGASAYGKG